VKDLIPLGIIVIFLGIFLIIIGNLTSTKEISTMVALGGFIGFIPFGFANDKRIFYIIITIAGLMALFYMWVIFQK
jgi:uncharacterized membrane protein